MSADPAAWIVFASVLSASIGFYGCALFASKRIREERRANWREGYAACNRDHERKRES
jgi:hypothetical protein